MTDRPKLYPGHQHQWAEDDGPVQIQGHSHSEPICAWPDCETYLTPEQMQERRPMVTCTVCGFEAPRNVAGLDGRITQPLARTQEEAAEQLLLYGNAYIDVSAQPEQGPA